MPLSQNFYVNNRRKLTDQLEVDSLTIIYSGREVKMSEDMNYPFFTNNHFYYLTGIQEPEVVLLIAKNRVGEIIEQLFIEEADPAKEKWVGKKINAREAEGISGIDEIHYTKDFKKEIVRYKSIATLYFDFKVEKHQSFNIEEAEIQNIVKQCALKDVYPILAQMRLIKEKEEMIALEKANALTKAGIEAIKTTLKPGMYEFEVAAFFEYFVKKEGGDGLAFESIVATGKNATILHYVSNKSQLKDGDLLLMDLGARINGYCGDISRTFSVNGNLSSQQEKLIEIVASVQQKMFEAYKPGAAMKDLQNLTKTLFLEHCTAAGFVPKNNDITEFYYHGIGHSLGLDTHDVRPEGDLILAPGMVLTVEPGLYLGELGIGIRIEDDVVITEEGCRVL